MSASKLRTHAIAVWHWLFPVYDRDFAHLADSPRIVVPNNFAEAAALKSDPVPHIVIPIGTDPTKVSVMIDLERRSLDRQLGSHERLDVLRDRILTLSLTGGGALAATAGATHLPPMAVLPTAILWLLAAIYITLARLPSDRPVDPRGSGFARDLPEGIANNQFLAWVLDGLARSTAAARAYSLVLARHVMVGTCLAIAGLVWLLVCSIGSFLASLC